MRPPMKIVKLHATNKIGSGWEIDAEYEDGHRFPAVKTEAIVHQFGYAPWLGPFTPKEFEDHLGETITQMVDLWNKKYGKESY